MIKNLIACLGNGVDTSVTCLAAALTSPEHKLFSKQEGQASGPLESNAGRQLIGSEALCVDVEGKL